MTPITHHVARLTVPVPGASGNNFNRTRKGIRERLRRIHRADSITGIRTAHAAALGYLVGLVDAGAMDVAALERHSRTMSAAAKLALSQMRAEQ